MNDAAAPSIANRPDSFKGFVRRLRGFAPVRARRATGHTRMSAAPGLYARFAPAVVRGWPVERIAEIYNLRIAGCENEGIGRRLGISPDTVGAVCRRLFDLGVLAPRNKLWPQERTEAFIEGWDEGLSLAEIGRRIGVTKNAAVSASHRLLAQGIIAERGPRARAPSPAETERSAAERQRLREERRAAKAEQERLRAERTAAKAEALAARERTRRLVPAALSRPLAPAPRSKAQRYVPPPTSRRVISCCWPIGAPGTEDFRFCERPSDPGRPYCHAHVGHAYVRVPEVRRAKEARV